MSSKIKVLVADDHAVWRSGMRAELGEAFWVVGEAEDAPTAIELADRLQPDVVAADLRMPDGGGLRVAAELSDRFPLVILTVSEAHDDLLAAIGAGAVGYLVKSSTVAEIGAGLHPGRPTGEGAVGARAGGAAAGRPRQHLPRRGRGAVHRRADRGEPRPQHPGEAAAQPARRADPLGRQARPGRKAATRSGG